jgi:indole-3-glycerol phosphate synthase
VKGILEDILTAKARRPPYSGADHSDLPRRSLLGAIRASSDLAVIAEFKRRSPSGGDLKLGADALDTASAYQAAGAAALSILTEPDFFLGAPADLAQVRLASPLPVLRKDFLVGESDIWESRAMGADAVLLIVRLLGERLGRLLSVSQEAGLEALVEVHDATEVKAALAAGAQMVGINNRDLDTLNTDLGVSTRLAPLVRGQATVVSESGLGQRSQCLELKDLGVDAFLIGETLLRGGSAAIFGTARPS